MTRLLEIRQQLKLFYREYERILTKLIRFLFSFSVIYFVNLYMGQNDVWGNPVTSIVLAFICCMIPISAVAPITCICILVQFYGMSTEITIVTLCIFMIMVLMYYIFKCGNSWLMPLMTLLCIFKVPGILLIGVGLMTSPITIVPLGFGVLVFRMMEMMKTEYLAMFSQTTVSALQKIVWFFTGIAGDGYKLLLVTAVVVTVLLVYGIRRMQIDYSWAIAIATGAISYLLTMLLGAFAFDIKVDIPFTLLGTFGGVVVAMVLYLFVFAVDYSRTEFVQFEDEEYYYYVKVVPKVSVAAQDWKVKHITITEKDDSVEEKSPEMFFIESEGEK